MCKTSLNNIDKYVNVSKSTIEKVSEIKCNGQEGDDVICKSCYDHHFAPICSQCKQKITEKKSVKFKGGEYHMFCYEQMKNREEEPIVDGSAAVRRAGLGVKKRTGGGSASRGGVADKSMSMSGAKKQITSLVDEYSSLL